MTPFYRHAEPIFRNPFLERARRGNARESKRRLKILIPSVALPGEQRQDPEELGWHVLPRLERQYDLVKTASLGLRAYCAFSDKVLDQCLCPMDFRLQQRLHIAAGDSILMRMGGCENSLLVEAKPHRFELS